MDDIEVLSHFPARQTGASGAPQFQKPSYRQRKYDCSYIKYLTSLQNGLRKCLCGTQVYNLQGDNSVSSLFCNNNLGKYLPDPTSNRKIAMHWSGLNRVLEPRSNTAHSKSAGLQPLLQSFTLAGDENVCHSQSIVSYAVMKFHTFQLMQLIQARNCITCI